jgi:hypothetical protein
MIGKTARRLLSPLTRRLIVLNLILLCVLFVVSQAGYSQEDIQCFTTCCDTEGGETNQAPNGGLSCCIGEGEGRKCVSCYDSDGDGNMEAGECWCTQGGFVTPCTKSSFPVFACVSAFCY